MIVASGICWLALALPGYAALRRFSPGDQASGIMGTLTLSYLYTFGLLSPISIAFYCLRAPMGLFAFVLVAMVMISVVEISRRHGWKDLVVLVGAGVCFELVIVVCDLVLGARIGAFLGGDARVHLARVRFLLDHGFSNLDPFVSAPFFFPIYHTNLLHAVYAAFSYLLPGSSTEVWYESLPWAKLLLCSGAYYMGWAVFQRQWPAWAAALCCLGVRGPFNYVNYPNQLSFFWLSPLLIGFAAEACRSSISWNTVVKVCLASLVVGQFHGLFAIFSIMALAPPLAVACIVFAATRRRRQAWLAAACMAGLFVGLPFPYVSKFKSNPATVAPLEEVRAANEGGDFVTAGNGWLMRNPNTIAGSLGEAGWRIALLAAGILILLKSRDTRWPTVMVVGVMATVMLILYVPPICTFFLKTFREEWILERFGFYFVVCHQVLMAGAVAYGVDQFICRGVLRAPISLLALQLGGNALGGFAMVSAMPLPKGLMEALPRFSMVPHQKPYDWTMYFNTASGYASDHLGYLSSLEDFSSKLRQFVPAGETILADPFAGIDLVALHDCHIIASGSASNGVLTQADRMRDVNLMMHPDTPWPFRQRLLRQYGVRYFVPSRRMDYKWINGRTKRYEQVLGQLIVELNVD